LAPKVAVVELAGAKWKSVSYEDSILKRVERFDTDNVEGVKKEDKSKRAKTLDLESLLVKYTIVKMQPSAWGPHAYHFSLFPIDQTTSAIELG